MPTNKRPRKPRSHRQATIPVTIRHGADDERTLQLVPHAELVKLREGMGDECGWHTIACRVNIGATLARQNQYEDTVAAYTTYMQVVNGLAEFLYGFISRIAAANLKRGDWVRALVLGCVVACLLAEAPPLCNAALPCVTLRPDAPSSAYPRTGRGHDPEALRRNAQLLRPHPPARRKQRLSPCCGLVVLWNVLPFQRRGGRGSDRRRGLIALRRCGLRGEITDGHWWAVRFHVPSALRGRRLAGHFNQ